MNYDANFTNEQAFILLVFTINLLVSVGFFVCSNEFCACVFIENNALANFRPEKMYFEDYLRQ